MKTPPASQTFAALLRATPTDSPVYRTVAGRQLHLHRFAPAGLAATERRPAVMWIHGGAWRGGTPETLFPFARYLASRGAVNFSVEYRLVSPAALTVADCVEDCRAALDFLRSHAAELGVDPDRIAIGGESAGGHLAAALATFASSGARSRPTALLLYNPVLDLTEGDWSRFVEGGHMIEAMKGKPPPNPEALERARALSPVFHIGANPPPCLLLHGLEDKIVPVSQAERFASALRAAGGRCDLVLLPNTAHAFAVPQYKATESVVVDALLAADRFLVALDWLHGEATLTVSTPPAW